MSLLLAPKDTIDLIVTAAVLGTSPGSVDNTRSLVERADRVGQQLWDANYAAASDARGTELAAPAYSWEPVFDLMWQPSTDQADYSLTRQQTLQIERCRLFLRDNAGGSVGWERSAARLFLEQLGAAVAAHLHAPGQVPRVLEHDSAIDAPSRWTRSDGFPSTSAWSISSRSPMEG